MHDLLDAYEEHTVFAATTNESKKSNKKQAGNIGAENYHDKVIESTCGPEIFSLDLEKM